MADYLLEIKNLVIHYETDDGLVKALNGIDLELKKGHSLGLVGETGAGKTTLARGILGLVPNPPGKVVDGSILYEGQELLNLSAREMQEIRGQEISMIFQDPMTSLNPVMTIGEQIMEVIRTHHKVSKQEARQKAEEMLEQVGITMQRFDDYPHQLSGGMKQRVIIAIALACNPKLLIADEPTTALDVTIQAQVLEMIRKLKDKNNTSMLLITHDLGVVAQNCDYVAIIYAGEVVEYGALREVYHGDKHPYTEGLFGSIPSLTEEVDRLHAIEGIMADPMHLPEGCKFHTRCPYAVEACKTQKIPLVSVGGEHKIRCLRYQES